MSCVRLGWNLVSFLTHIELRHNMSWWWWWWWWWWWLSTCIAHYAERLYCATCPGALWKGKSLVLIEKIRCWAMDHGDDQAAGSRPSELPRRMPDVQTYSPLYCSVRFWYTVVGCYDLCLWVSVHVCLWYIILWLYDTEWFDVQWWSVKAFH